MLAVDELKALLEKFTEDQRGLLELISKAGLSRATDFLTALKTNLADGANSPQQFYWQDPEEPKTCLSFTFSDDSQALRRNDMESESPCFLFWVILLDHAEYKQAFVHQPLSIIKLDVYLTFYE